MLSHLMTIEKTQCSLCLCAYVLLVVIRFIIWALSYGLTLVFLVSSCLGSFGMHQNSIDITDSGDGLDRCHYGNLMDQSMYTLCDK